MVSASDGWAVGEGGTIIHYDGTSWLSVSSPTNKELNSIFMVSASDGWTVGEDGIILNYDGSDWSEFIDTGDEVWSDVFMVSASDGWMVGDSGRIYHYDGSDWSEFTDTGSTNWQSVYLFASDDGQVVGNNGDIYKYDGLEWTSVSSPTNKRLKTVQMLASDDSWAVGNSGIILHFIIEGLFKENGYFISSAFDMGDSSPIQTVEWDQSIPTCSPTCEIRLQIRAAPDASGSPGTWTNWYGENGVDTYFTNADGTIIPLGLNNNQWMQYRVELIGDNLDTPILQEARINYR
ncbi:hypothetical protein IID20_03370 [Patescibacteria group bacterium]|nr:hypothetical protein [Patescibacteria group bacterium]